MSLPFIPFINCAEVVIRASIASQAAYLTFGVHSSGVLVPSDLVDIADLVAAAVIADLLPDLHTSVSVQDVKVTDLTTQFSAVYVGGSGLPDSGGASGALSPNNVALVVSFKTANRGRSFRGRNYVFGLLAAQLASSTEWGTTIAGNVQTFYENMFSSLTAAGFTPSILSRFENNVRRTTGVATAITQVTGKFPIGTQRRRVEGHGI